MVSTTARSKREPQVARPDWALTAGATRKALLGFFLAGMLMSFLGPMLPAWGHHLGSDFSATGLYFLSMAAGILSAAPLAHKLLQRKSIAFSLLLASAAACAALLYLALVSPPVSAWWRLSGIFLLGGSGWLLICALFHAVTPVYLHDPAATVNIAGVLFVLGGLALALLVAGTFYAYTVPSILILLALIPGIFAGLFAGTSFVVDTARSARTWGQAWQDLRSPSAVLLALLLFFQFGNEWSIAGWLPIFLIQRLGISPASALMLLALYWLVLLVGRIAAQFVLPRVRHGGLLSGSVLAALLGCLVLTYTRDVFGAVAGILFLGAGFASVYPLVVEKIGFRFPYFHPSFFNGIFSFAMMGGLLAPWTLGYFADWWGIGVLMLLPLLGTVVVVLLLLLIWLEARLSGRTGTT